MLKALTPLPIDEVIDEVKRELRAQGVIVLSAPPAWATPDQGAEEEDVMWLWVPATAPQGGSAVHTFVLYPDAPTRALSSSSLSDGASNLPGGIAVWPLRAAPKSN